MKKLLTTAIIILFAIVMTIPVLAHGGYRNGIKRYELCTENGCDITGLHKHNNDLYRGNVCSRGTYRLCVFDDCEITGPHQHDEGWYCSQNCRLSDYETCGETDCTLTGLHRHDGIYYCAYREKGCCR